MNRILERAKELYYSRVGHKEEHFPYLWEQCSDAYKAAWMCVAHIEVEDEDRVSEYFCTHEYENM